MLGGLQNDFRFDRSVYGIKLKLKRFARATGLHLGSVGLTDSTVNADIVVQSPLAFELRVLRVGDHQP